jgi:hypothetical protein
MRGTGVRAAWLLGCGDFFWLRPLQRGSEYENGKRTNRERTMTFVRDLAGFTILLSMLTAAVSVIG